jgi:hypothetical protein
LRKKMKKMLIVRQKVLCFVQCLVKIRNVFINFYNEKRYENVPLCCSIELSHDLMAMISITYHEGRKTSSFPAVC